MDPKCVQSPHEPFSFLIAIILAWDWMGLVAYNFFFLSEWNSVFPIIIEGFGSLSPKKTHLWPINGEIFCLNLMPSHIQRWASQRSLHLCWASARNNRSRLLMIRSWPEIWEKNCKINSRVEITLILHGGVWLWNPIRKLPTGSSLCLSRASERRSTQNNPTH